MPEIEGETPVPAPPKSVPSTPGTVPATPPKRRGPKGTAATGPSRKSELPKTTEASAEAATSAPSKGPTALDGKLAPGH
jgi:hypothetical protein